MMLNSNTNAPDIIDRGASVKFLLSPIAPYLEDQEITEICVNRPDEVWCERANQWERHHVSDLDAERLSSIATAVARFSANDISDVRPMLSAVLPNGERIQIVIPPACEHGTISMTIRKPSFATRSLEDYAQGPFFSHVQANHGGMTPTQREGLPPDARELLSLMAQQDYVTFFRRAIQQNKVIVVAGETGSGKTTFMKALMQEIPKEQRLITIEDVPELFLPNHPNHVHLFYPSEAKEEENARVTAASLLRSCLRMKPSRILLAELRGGETFDFINIAASGHGGSITSCHAGSAELAFERLALMVLQNRQGRTLPYPVIRRLLHMLIDIVVHIHNDAYSGKSRYMTEVWYAPHVKQGGLDG